MAQVLFKGVPDFSQVHIEVEKVKREVASISATPVKMGAGNAAKELKEVSTAAEKAAVSTKKVTVANDLLGDSFTNIYKKMLVWQVMGTMVSKTLGAFRDALDMMKKVDDELVTVRKVTGATAYFADSDGRVGSIISQRAVEVLPDDTRDTLARRVMEEGEWKLLSEAVKLFCTGRLSVHGKRVVIE